MLTLDQAQTTLSELAGNDKIYNLEAIRETALAIRAAYKTAGHDVSEGSDIDKKINNATKCANHRSLKSKIKILKQAGIDGAYDYRYIAALYQEVLAHRQALKLPHEKASILNTGLRLISLKAHATCAENIEWQLQRSQTPQEAKVISHKAICVLQHHIAIGKAIEFGSERFRQLWEAVYAACKFSTLTETATHRVFTDVENWFKLWEEKREVTRTLNGIASTMAMGFKPPPGYRSFQEKRRRDLNALNGIYSGPDRPTPGIPKNQVSRPAPRKTYHFH